MTTMIGIDVETSGKKRLISALRKLRTTHSIEDCGVYRQDSAYSVVRLTTDWSLDELEAWAYRVKAAEGFVGAWVQRL